MADHTDRIREAARLMAEDHPKGHERHMMWGAMSGWLNGVAEMMDRDGYPMPSFPLVVAAYYLDAREARP